MNLNLLAHAKINLFLDVLDLRPDGYHDVVMLNQSITPGDPVAVTRFDEPGLVRLHCDNPAIPSDERNLAHKAVVAWRKATGQNFGVEIHVEKRIPMEAGLAGGSADAAGVLVGLDRLAGNPNSLEQLADIGATFGSDIPFCVIGGSAWCTGRGEVVEPLATPAVDWACVLISPTVSVSTGAAYKKLDANPHRPHPDPAAIRAAFLSGDFSGVCRLLYNAFESVILPDAPEIAAAKDALLAAGAAGALMTGSGSNVFGLYPDRQSARAAVSGLCAAGWKAQLSEFRPAGVADLNP